jgi:hypothetical protein
MNESELIKAITINANLGSDEFSLSIDEDKKIISAWNTASLNKGALIGSKGNIAIAIDKIVKRLYGPEWKFEVVDPLEEE